MADFTPRQDGSPLEAAQALGRHPNEAVPLLVPHVGHGRWVAHALGLAATPKAIEALAGEMRAEKNLYLLLDLLEGLLAAGDVGRAAIQALQPAAQGNLRGLIERLLARGTLEDLRSGGGRSRFT
jgi:hypothetical protein